MFSLLISMSTSSRKLSIGSRGLTLLRHVCRRGNVCMGTRLLHLSPDLCSVATLCPRNKFLFENSTNVSSTRWGPCFDHEPALLLVNSCKIIRRDLGLKRPSVLLSIQSVSRNMPKRLQRTDYSQCEESKRKKAIVEQQIDNLLTSSVEEVLVRILYCYIPI